MSGVVRVAKRHKKKLIFTVLLVSGGYLSIKYALRRLKESLFMSPASAALNQRQYFIMRKYEHYLTIKQTSDEAATEWIRPLQDKISHALSIDELLEQLKQKPPNKLELWEKMKVRCVAKFLASIYAVAMFTALFKVELNVIGGFLYVRNTLESKSVHENPIAATTRVSHRDTSCHTTKGITLTPRVQQKYFANIESFLSSGVNKLIEQVHNCCEDELKDVTLKEVITGEQLRNKLVQIEQRLLSRQSETSLLTTTSTTTIAAAAAPKEGQQFNSFVRFVHDYLIDGSGLFAHATATDPTREDNLSGWVVADAETTPFMLAEDEPSELVVLANLNSETREILCSDDFNTTLISLTANLTNESLHKLSLYIQQQVPVTDTTAHGTEQREQEANRSGDHATAARSVGLPFAKLIPILDKAAYVNSTTDQSFLNDQNLNLFSANIYESYSYVEHEYEQEADDGGMKTTLSMLAAVSGSSDSLFGGNSGGKMLGQLLHQQAASM